MHCMQEHRTGEDRSTHFVGRFEGCHHRLDQARRSGNEGGPVAFLYLPRAVASSLPPSLTFLTRKLQIQVPHLPYRGRRPPPSHRRRRQRSSHDQRGNTSQGTHPQLRLGRYSLRQRSGSSPWGRASDPGQGPCGRDKGVVEACVFSLLFCTLRLCWVLICLLLFADLGDKHVP